MGRPIGPFVVTRTVGSWHAAETPNFGFVITPEHGQVTLNAAAVSEVDQQFMCGVMTGE
jgi:hypothetical protein